MTASSHSNKVQPMEMKLQRYSFLMWHLLFLRVFEPFFFFGHRIHALPVLFFLVVCLFSMHAFYARFINFIGVKNWGTGRNGRWFCKKSAITISIHNKEEVPYYLPSLHWSKIATSLLYFDASLLFLCTQQSISIYPNSCFAFAYTCVKSFFLIMTFCSTSTYWNHIDIDSNICILAC